MNPDNSDALSLSVVQSFSPAMDGLRTDSIESFEDMEFDYVVTMCDNAKISCPYFPASTLLHRGFDDPPKLAEDAVDEEEAMVHYRRVRDETRAFVEKMPETLKQNFSMKIRHWFVKFRHKHLLKKTS